MFLENEYSINRGSSILYIIIADNLFINNTLCNFIIQSCLDGTWEDFHNEAINNFAATKEFAIILNLEIPLNWLKLQKKKNLDPKVAEYQRIFCNSS